MNCYLVRIRQDESSIIFVKPSDSKQAAHNIRMVNNYYVTELEVSKSLTGSPSKATILSHFNAAHFFTKYFFRIN
jgi:hypothetical protein